jgi:hypothetical protein
MTEQPGIKSSGDSKFFTWEEINDHFIKMVDENPTEMMQKINLLSFVQMLGSDKMAGVELTMYTDKPDVVTFDIIRHLGETRFFVCNVSFLIDGTTMLTVSDYQRRGWSNLLKYIFMFPRFKRKYFYYVFPATQVDNALMTKLLALPTAVAGDDKATFKLEKFANELFGTKALHV